MARTIIAFIERPEHKFMCVADMADGGKKLFGISITITLSENENKSFDEVVEALQKTGTNIGFVIEDDNLWTNDDFWAFSLGDKFIFKSDLIAQFNERIKA